MELAGNKKAKINSRAGSALILAVVLTSLLAIIGTMFILVSRVDKISTSAISENKELNLAVESVIARIAQELAADLPYLDPCDPNFSLLQEYYDYPDPCNAWLAYLEPYEAAPNVYYWRQISDIYNKIGPQGTGLEAYIIPDYQASDMIGDSNTYIANNIFPADADGDGVSDSVWVKLDDMSTNKGKPIYAAARVVDNSGMLNVNTAYKFDPNSLAKEEIDGSRQLHINLLALSNRGSNPYAEKNLIEERTGGSTTFDVSNYENDVVWNYKKSTIHTPFDISDELELRYRYLINLTDIDARIENFWSNSFKRPNLEAPLPWDNLPSARQDNLDEWFGRAQYDISDPNSDYSYRHIGTTVNMDRIINPFGRKMVNINHEDDITEYYIGVRAGFLDGGIDNAALAAQMAVNIKDYSDSNENDEQVSYLDIGNNTYYGFERPCIFISELAVKSKKVEYSDSSMQPLPPPYHRSYAIELRKRYRAANNDHWRIAIRHPIRNDPNDFININYDTSNTFSTDARRYQVIIFQDPCVPLDEDVLFSDSPDDGETGVDPDIILRWGNFRIMEPNGEWLTADSYDVYFGLDKSEVSDANMSGDVYKGRQNTTSYDPYDPLTLNTNLATETTYYWRVDAIRDGNVMPEGKMVPPWSFTTWIAEPNTVRRIIGPNDIIFDPCSIIRLERRVEDGTYIVVDSAIVDPNLVAGEGDTLVTKSSKRDVASNYWVKRLWKFDGINTATLGNSTNHFYPFNTEPVYARPAGRSNNIGEIGRIFGINVYDGGYWRPETVEGDVRIDVADPNYQQLFRYLTVMDPNNHIKDPNETRVKGRININTAPWYVIAQLPWVSAHSKNPYALAKAIVAYRDKLNLSTESGPDYYRDDAYKSREIATDKRGLRNEPGFASIGELTTVVNKDNMREYAIDYYIDSQDEVGFPDLSTSRWTKVDGRVDDLEERDLIFARISDLVTVRSDIYTAYILVRIGTDGPQKRAIAILDRSEAKSGSDKVKILALHMVPDPR